MFYAVDFSIKVNNCFHTVHTAFIEAQSVSECQHQAEKLREQITMNKDHHIHIFIEA